MKRLYILCEGQTEETFVRLLLSPYLQSMGVISIPIICMTKRTPSKKYKGGVGSFAKIKNEIQRLCSEHPHEMVTTMFDLYAFPYNMLDIADIPRDIYNKAETIEKAATDNIANKFDNLIFNLVLHEFEGLLFSDTSAFESIANDKDVAILHDIRAAVSTPEHINESPETAPSKHIERVIPTYSKITDGIDIAEQIGIDKMMSECRHFSEWLNKLITWAKEVS